MKILKSFYSILRDWFDPSLEGSPYDDYRVRNKKRRPKYPANQWVKQRWVKLSV